MQGGRIRVALAHIGDLTRALIASVMQAILLHVPDPQIRERADRIVCLTLWLQSRTRQTTSVVRPQFDEIKSRLRARAMKPSGVCL